MWPELRNKKLFIFDMDGVLIDSSMIHSKAYCETLKNHNININFHYPDYAGFKTKDVFRSCLELFNEPFTESYVEQLAQEKSKLSLANIDSSEIIFEGVEELLHTIHSLDGAIALASSASVKTVEKIRHKYSLDRYIQFYQSSEDVLLAKPNPEIFINCLKYFKIENSDAVVFEDSIAGIEAAHVAGIDVIGISTTFAFKDLKDLNKCKIVVETIKEIGQII